MTQKAFIRVYKNLAKLRDPSKFSSWIYQIAANLCRDEIKKMSHRNFISLDLIQENNENDGHRLPDELHESIDASPETRLNQKQIGSIVQKTART